MASPRGGMLSSLGGPPEQGGALRDSEAGARMDGRAAGKALVCAGEERARRPSDAIGGGSLGVALFG